MKKLVTIFLLLAFMSPSFAETFQGHLEQTEIKQEELDKKMFTGETEILDKDDVVKMTVSQVLSSGYTMQGDEFFAEITEDVKTDKGIIVPVGTVVHGVVENIVEPKNMGRDGYVILNFDYLITPDGREIPIQGSTTTKDNKAVGVAKTVAEHVGYTAVGGVAGGLLALNMFGIEAAIASQGYTVAGGAALGGVAGLTAAIVRKGEGVLIKPGDELKIKILSSNTLPVFSKDAFRQEEILFDGLNVRINNVKFEKDPFGEENTITISLGIDNFSSKTFSAYDIALLSDTQNVFFPSPFSDDTSLWLRTIKSGERVVGKLSFAVNDRKRKHWLVFYDKSTRKPIAKYSIDNARQDLLEKKENSKKSKRRKK